TPDRRHPTRYLLAPTSTVTAGLALPITAAQSRRETRSCGPLLACAVAVLAPRPAAGSALAFFQLLLGPPNAARPGGLLLGILDPADELVAGQWRDVVPGIEGRRVG